MIGSAPFAVRLVAGFALCLLGAATASAPAYAQIDEVHSSVKEAERTMQDYAECIVGRSSSRQKLDQYLRLSPNRPDYNKLGQKLASDSCVPHGVGQVTMRFQPVMFRFSLYEARYRREFGKSSPPDATNAPPLDLVAEFDVGADHLPREVVFMRALGNCVVRLDAANAHKLVLSRLHSNDEAALVTALQPSMGVCVPEGSTFRFSRTMLRGALAEALYKFQPRRAPARVAS